MKASVVVGVLALATLARCEPDYCDVHRVSFQSVGLLYFFSLQLKFRCNGEFYTGEIMISSYDSWFKVPPRSS